ncbi:hypothetical protein Hypma_014048 [Hypsizygus marmoreus]|uniref:Uncharacterized protein n=1 Tax=Hypsizygus marmoreus TaxID=39966 RepID=A0A369KAD8_HYPMA|nr:hypothetical protein Hypma_014048 [Hypsizygus marmoreus]
MIEGPPFDAHGVEAPRMAKRLFDANAVAASWGDDRTSLEEEGLICMNIPGRRVMSTSRHVVHEEMLGAPAGGGRPPWIRLSHVAFHCQTTTCWSSSAVIHQPGRRLDPGGLSTIGRLVPEIGRDMGGTWGSALLATSLATSLATRRRRYSHLGGEEGNIRRMEWHVLHTYSTRRRTSLGVTGQLIKTCENVVSDETLVVQGRKRRGDWRVG